MKEKINKICKYVSIVISVFNLLMFFAMRPCWSGISKTLGYENNGAWIVLNLPLILCVIMALVLISNIVMAILFKQAKRWPLAYSITGIVFLIAIIIVIKFGAIDYMRFIWPNFFISVGILALVLGFIYLVFVYPKTKLAESKLFKYGLVIAITLVAVSYLTSFSINSISFEPVVYAVENEYQIVFSSSSKSLGYVTINNKEYYDLYSGSEKSNTKVHKVSVPMEDLDAAKSYEITVQRQVYRGPFGGYLGKKISKSYSFTPVNTTDGLQYLSFSDIHMHLKGALKTASYVTNYDFLVLNGDLVSDVETFRDANYINKVGFAITKGTKPVVYARGNHETKGAYSEELYKFVGSKNEKFYFNFYFKDVYGITLDIGEDHDDEWWEYYTTAKYDLYRQEQLEFVNSEIEKGDFNNYKYRLAVCHIPVCFVNNRYDHESIKRDLTTALNQMDIDMLLSAHQHDVFIFEPGAVPGYDKEGGLDYNVDFYTKSRHYKGYLTDFNFPSLMITKPGYTQNPFDEDPRSIVGLVVNVDLDSSVQTCYYLNSNGEKLDLYNPFADIHYGKEITIDSNKNFSRAN